MNNESTNGGRKRSQPKKSHQSFTLVYLDMGINKKKIGRLTIKLYDAIVPRTVNNFKAFIRGFKGYSYKGCNMHRIIPDFCVQGGDLTRGDGTGGFSIYGDKFEDENFSIKHDQMGVLSMANSGPGTNGSQFFITLKETPHLDGVHVGFGAVVDGEEVLHKLNSIGSPDGTPRYMVTILDCGFL